MLIRRVIVAPLTMTALLAVGGCVIGDVDRAGDDAGIHPTSATTDARPSADASRGDGRPPADEKTPAVLDGAVIWIDPGHAGIAPPADLLVTDGRGGMKPCNTSGTSADDGWPEHTFNWELGQRLTRMLQERGARVKLSRANDDARADCIDERARRENASDADVVVSLHADGASEGARGFHVSAISSPLPENDVEGSTRLAEALRDAMVDAGFTPSNYLGSEGLNPRSDLTGLNLSTKPKALLEFGNMRDSADIAILRSPEGQERLAAAVVEGIARYLDAAKGEAGRT